MTPKDWSIWITIGTLAAGGIARFVSLEEAKTIGIANDTRQDTTASQIESRVRALESNSTLAIQLTALTGEVQALKQQVRELRDELRERRKR